MNRYTDYYKQTVWIKLSEVTMVKPYNAGDEDGTYAIYSHGIGIRVTRDVAEQIVRDVETV